MMASDSQRCRSCVHFNGSAGEIERAFPGLLSLGSAHASVRALDGLCMLLGRYVSACSVCARHSAAPANLCSK
ncbi:MAG: hypothetical protein ABSH33_11660 [Steroidobacteraceae bacterium]|jgi:hypothetical protein